MAIDAKLNKDGDLFINDRGDVDMISGTEEFEQRLMLYVQQYFSQEIGTSENRDNTIEHLRVQANRVAQDFDMVERLNRFDAEFIAPREVDINVQYEGADGEGETYHFQVTK